MSWGLAGDGERVCSVGKTGAEKAEEGCSFASGGHRHQGWVSGRGKGCFGEQACPGDALGGCVSPHRVYPCLPGTSLRDQPWEGVSSYICALGSLRDFFLQSRKSNEDSYHMAAQARESSRAGQMPEPNNTHPPPQRQLLVAVLLLTSPVSPAGSGLVLQRPSGVRLA